MAEDVVIKEYLSDALIDAGAALTKKLDEMGAPITAAFWLFVPDLNEWRLYFASPHVATHGARELLMTIHRAISELGEQGTNVPLSMTGVLDVNADPAKQFRAALHVTGIGRVRFTKSTINGHFIDDALIYRAA